MNSETDCGNPVLIKLYHQRSHLSDEDRQLLDTLIAKCLRSDPCNAPGLQQILDKPGELTVEDYRIFDSLKNDCDNFRTLSPTPAWKYVVAAAAVLSLIPWYMLITTLGKISPAP